MYVSTLALIALLIAVWPVPNTAGALIEQAEAQARINYFTEIKSSTTAPQADKDLADKEIAEAKILLADISMRIETARILSAGKTQSPELSIRLAGIDKWLGPGAELRILLLVVVSAALGSMVHGSLAFGWHNARASFNPSWNWWYVLRLPTGIGIAIFFYCVVRAGFMPVNLSASELSNFNAFAIAAVSALAGMFSRDAMKTLAEIFRSRYSSTAERPVIEEKSIKVAKDSKGEALHVKLKGRNFAQGMSAELDGARRVVVVKSDTEATLTLLEGDVLKTGPVPVTLANPGSHSVALTLEVTAAPSTPIAQGPKISKATAPKSGDPATLTVKGVGLSNVEVVVVGKSERKPKNQSDSELTAEFTRNDLDTGKCKVRDKGNVESDEVTIELTVP